ncbi:BPTI domain-containing protein [Sedimentitalea nanhaiensis]|uniref:hypothetical protein n=1 Tax=Sedimentitalea nanhaiensis TaxID=999627 RepID=UPI000488AC9B|nr:hypothetical protein [Sedimentitalea nanhaiensis]
MPASPCRRWASFRWNYNATKGYGAGLAIANMVREQSGIKMEITSPHPNSDRRFPASLQLPITYRSRLLLGLRFRDFLIIS